MLGYRGRGVRTWSLKGAALAGAAVAVIGAPAWAGELRRFDIPSQDLSAALEAFGRQSDQDIVFDAGRARGRRAPAVIGPYRPDDALQRLLYGSGLQARRVNATSVMVEAVGPQPEAVAAAPEPAIVEELVVTGTRIRGAPPASPVTVVTADQIRDAGQHDLGEVVRSLPQNFNGGRNPGAGSGRGSGNNNYGGTSTLNLRGVGNDASLTLLNGHRLATNVIGGVDIGAIPIAAVERLEVLADGASALYGSDAVGGVANIITKRAVSGVTASALYGGSTDGGYTHHQYSLSGGGNWRGGGVVAGVGAWKNTAVHASQRDYTGPQNPEDTLYPGLERFNGFISLTQDLPGGAQLALDGLYSNLVSRTLSAFTAAPLNISGERDKIATRAYVLAPSLRVSLPAGWALETYATYGLDRTRNFSQVYAAGAVSATAIQCYCNTARALEVNAEGGLWRGPAGATRLALGAGYRDNRNAATTLFMGAPLGQQYRVKDAVRYAFGELNLPLVAPDQAVRFVHSLRLSAAVRYEDYAHVRSVATPKLGAVYAVTPAVTLKASWGKSFKVPVFSQRYENQSASLRLVSGYGSLYPAGATYISVSGGSPNLRPETANSSTFTAEVQPARWPGLKVEASYYHIAFKDRVVYPIATSAGALANPLYAPFVTRDPSVAAQAAAYAAAPRGLVNNTGAAYDPSRVVAILDARATNASAQTIDGLDLSVRYRVTLAQGDSLQLNASATYLDITQRLLPTSPEVGLTGNFYRPRHLQARAGATWDHGPLALSVFANHVGAARYRGVTPILDIAAETTVDAVLRWTAPAPIGASFALQATNLFNGKPTTVPGGQPYETAFDAASYAVTGRIISLQVSKTF